MSDTIRWGIVGTGNIARKFAKAVKQVDGAALVAVASRAQASADRFGDEFGAPHRHIGAEALAQDSDVDAVYVATPHPMHKTDTLACLAGDKAALCEKPFAMNRTEAVEMIECARARKLFLMEAMWTTFFPAMAKARELIEAGAIGDVRLVQGNFCFRGNGDVNGRLLNPELGGGALLDVGIYTVALAHMVYGKAPSQIKSVMQKGQTGVDEMTALILTYDNGAMATLTSGINLNTTHEGVVFGSSGSIRILDRFWRPDRIVVTKGEDEEEIRFDTHENGFVYEIAEVVKCLRDGKLESDIMPLERTLAMVETMDEARKQNGLVYPMEQ